MSTFPTLKISKRAIRDLKDVSDILNLLIKSLTTTMDHLAAALLNGFLPKADHLSLHDRWERPTLEDPVQQWVAMKVYSGSLPACRMLEFDEISLPTLGTSAQTPV